METLKETWLLTRLKAGDSAAFAEAYELFAQKIYRHALYRTSSPEVAEDIMSETFVRAWAVVRERAGDIKRFRPFLYRIADNLIIDFYRRRAKEPGELPEGIEERLPSDAHIPEGVDRLISHDKLMEALGCLREETKHLLVMRYVDDLSITEISNLTGKKANAIYVALHRAVKDLQRVCNSMSFEN